MPEFLRLAISAIAAIILVPLVLNAFSKREQIRESPAGFTAEYPKGMTVLMFICSIFFSALAILAWRFPGKTNPSELPFAIGTFIAFAILGLFSAWLMRRSNVSWSEKEIAGADGFGRRQRFDWQELAGVRIISWAQVLSIESNTRQAIWVSPMMSGFNKLQSKLAQEQARIKGFQIEESDVLDFSPEDEAELDTGKQ